MPRQFIYLIEAENGLVKIGLGQNVRDRLMAVRTHSSCRVRLIAQWPGSAAVDDMLKARFAAHRQHCEWFACKGDFAEFVADWRGHGVDHVPEWPDLAYENAEDYRRARQAATKSGSRRKIGAAAGPNVFGLTPQQARCLAIIREHNGRLGCSPSYAELAEALVLKSKSGVHRLVHSLVERGHLRILPGAGRTVALVEPVAPIARAA